MTLAVPPTGIEAIIFGNVGYPDTMSMMSL